MTQQQIAFDRPDQLQQIQEGVMQGETILAVYDAVGMGTGFIGLTDKRVILQDKSFSGKKIAVTSIPYAKIDSVSFVGEAKAFRSTSSIAIHAGTRSFEVDFRGEDKARHAHNVILFYLGVR